MNSLVPHVFKKQSFKRNHGLVLVKIIYCLIKAVWHLLLIFLCNLSYVFWKFWYSKLHSFPSYNNQIFSASYSREAVKRDFFWNYTKYSFSALNEKTHPDCTCYEAATEQGWPSEKQQSCKYNCSFLGWISENFPRFW